MSDRSPGFDIALRIAISVVTGGAAFVIGNLLQDPLDVTLGEQFILSIIVGGVTLLSQLLIGFGHSQAELVQRLERKQAELVERLEKKQEETCSSITGDVMLLGQRISEVEQNAPRQLMNASALDGDQLMELLERASKITKATHPLIIDLTKDHVDKVSLLMRHMSDEVTTEMPYEGEDREWLLSLAQNVRKSILATSLFTVDAGRKTFEGGFWLSDLGSRYLAVQRAAHRRNVDLRRIFVYSHPDFVHDESFVRVRRLHREAGVKIKGINETILQKNEHLGEIDDFIVFDEVLTYKTRRGSRINRSIQPSRIETRVVKDPEAVRQDAEYFEELWAAAEDLPDDTTTWSTLDRDPLMKGR
jgi:hypothetical protein